MKVLGVAYLLWLAWRVATATVSADTKAAKPFGFFTAVLFQWLNPKASIMTLGAFSIFTTVGGAVLAETLLITASFALAFIPAGLLWTVTGLSARRFLTSRKTVTAFNVSMGTLIAFSTSAVLV